MWHEKENKASYTSMKKQAKKNISLISQGERKYLYMIIFDETLQHSIKRLFLSSLTFLFVYWDNVCGNIDNLVCNTFYQHLVSYLKFLNKFCIVCVVFCSIPILSVACFLLLISTDFLLITSLGCHSPDLTCSHLVS